MMRISVLARYLQVYALANWRKRSLLTVNMINTAVVEIGENNTQFK